MGFLMLSMAFLESEVWNDVLFLVQLLLSPSNDRCPALRNRGDVSLAIGNLNIPTKYGLKYGTSAVL